MSVHMGGHHDGGHGMPSAAATAAMAAAAAAATAAAAGTPISNSTHWSTEETKLLIRTWGEHREEFAEIKRNLSVWNKVLERLLNAGFYRTVEQCRNRWKFLESKYKTAARDIDSAGTTPWEFFDDMERAKHTTAHRRNSSASSAGMRRRLYESPSQSPSYQSSTPSLQLSHQSAGAQVHPAALFADPYGRMHLPPIRPTAAAAPPAATSSPQHSRLYQPRQVSPSVHYPGYHPSSSSSCPAQLYSSSHAQSYETVAASAPPRRLSPHQQQQQQQLLLRQQARMYRPPASRDPALQTQQHFGLRQPSLTTPYSHHPLAAGHLPESHSSTPATISPASASADASHPNQPHTPRPSLVESGGDASDHGKGIDSNEVELVGTISRTDLLSFLREQSQLRQQHESVRAKERMRNEDIRREEEWRFHEYQMSLMQLIQHSLAPFAVGGDDENLEQSQQSNASHSPPVLAQRGPDLEDDK
ncbi:hypothetical protein GGI20_004163, partial [Coemansia sp. BCRC 34301]